MPTDRYEFASDNAAGINPDAWAALSEANNGFSAAYGDDDWTRRACDLIRETFETDCEVFFTFTGTAANALALASLCQPYHSVICHEFAHVETDECGAPEFYSNGTKVLLAAGPLGKLQPASIAKIVTRRSDLHYPKPRVISITQPTELGTTYSVDELAALGRTALDFGLRIHMDGARFANALVSLEASPADLTWRQGVDVLCLGSTKLGAAVGDAVVFFDRELAAEFEYRCKQAGQLASKMRFLTAPWVGMLEDGAWLRHAAHANACARELATGLDRQFGIEILHPVDANAVFARLPAHVSAHLRDCGWHLYDFIGEGGTRFMCSWQTTEADIADLLRDIASAPPA